MTNVAVLEAYARLHALRDNLPTADVARKYVLEYHQILDMLQQAEGIELANFRIPDAEIRPVAVGSNYITGETYYSDEPFADHSFVLMKVDAALRMFSLLRAAASPNGTEVVFSPPSR